MIIDYDDELTTLNGQAITASAAGTKTKDAGNARDWGAGAPLVAYAKVGAVDFTNATSIKIDIEGSDDASRTNPVVLASKTVLLAGLKANTLIRVGQLAPGTSKKVLNAYFTLVGTAPDAGKLTVWVGRNADAPQNKVHSV